MFKISTIKYSFLAYLSPILILLASLAFPAPAAGETSLPVAAIADQNVPSVRVVPPGFYQFNNLEILKGPNVDTPPAEIDIIQKSAIPCLIYEGGNLDRPLPCPAKKDKEKNFAAYTVQVDERTTLLGVDREPAVLSDFSGGDNVNILGWLSSDSKIIRAAVLRNLAPKQYHQSLSGTIKSVNANGFILVLNDGSEVHVKTPIIEGAQVTVKGVFDRMNNFVNDVLSIIVKPFIVLQPAPAVEETPAPKSAPSKAPSALFKNFLKVFGL